MNNKILGYTYVVGDIIHDGHLLYLENSSKLCDVLLVGVLSDKAVMEKKSNPIMSFEERLNIVKNLKFVKCAVPQDDYSPLNNCKWLRPDILFESSSHKEMPANNFMKSINSRVIVWPYYPAQSSTKIKEKIHEKNELAIKQPLGNPTS